MSRPAAASSAIDLDAQYRAATTGAVMAERPDIGRLLCGGRDAADLLHRLSTNAVTGLASGQGIPTVFTTAKGRILDLVTLHRIDAGILVLGAATRMPALGEWVERYTFREEVTVADLGASHRTLGLFGPEAAARAERLWGPPAAALPRHHVLEVDTGGGAWVVRGFPLAGDGFLVTAPASAWDAVRAAVLDAASAGRVVEVGPACVEVLRIAAGLPAHPNELNEEHNPWEARLDDAISLAKGCYVGQEVIARLNTYRKVSRFLVRIAVHGPAPATGDEVRAAGDRAGVVTSAAAIPDGSGRSTGLAYVRDEDAVPGREVTVVGAAGAVAGVVEGMAR